MKISLISTSLFPGDQGLRTISACLKREGHDVKMIFLPMFGEYSKVYSQEVVEQVSDFVKGSKLIGIGSMASTSKRAIQLIKYFQNLGYPVIWGGPHPTFFPQDCFKHCNIVAVGEAEYAFNELAKRIENNNDYLNIPNLWVRKDGKEIINDVGSPVQDLDWLANPDFEFQDQIILENEKLIPIEERHLYGVYYFQTERGCPQACSYCTNNILRDIYKGKSDLLRTHSVDYVINEFKRIKTLFPSIGVFDIRDETFLIRNVSWLREFSERYKKEINIRFKCLSEPASMGIEKLSDEKIRLLVEAGLTDIIIGIQSGSDRLNMKLYNRFISADQVVKAAQMVNKYNDKLSVMYDIITCNPYETKEDILDTIKLLMRIPKPYFCSVNNLIFFEGTPLYKKAIEDGYIKNGFDSATELNYWDRWQHIKLKKKNAYLNLVLNLMRGRCTDKRYGIIPSWSLKILINDKIVNFNLKFILPTYIVGYLVQGMDNFREYIVKPMYRMMPTSFKVWYDLIRFKTTV